MNIHVYEPAAYNDAEAIGQAVVSGTTVILNVRRMSVEESQRTIDFLTGVAYALDGTIQKVGHKVLLVAPKNCDVSGQINPSED